MSMQKIIVDWLQLNVRQLCVMQFIYREIRQLSIACQTENEAIFFIDSCKN